MSLTPETLTRHELNGLPVRVVDAANPDLAGSAEQGSADRSSGQRGGETASNETATPSRSPREEIEGRVVAETQGTLSVASADRVRQVPKRGSTFEFALTDEAAAPVRESGTASKRGSETAGVRSGQSGSRQGVAYVTVDGARLLSRPELRTEKAGDSTWQ